MRRPLALAGLTAGLGFIGLSTLDVLRAAPPQFGTNVVIVDATDPALPRQAGIDTSGNLKINCVAGCSAGSGTGANNADNVASVGTGLGSSVSYGYVYDGTQWDRAYGDSTNGAFINIKAFNGTAPVTGSGTATGALRVELPTNGTGIVGLAAGSNTIGALTANQSVNVAQIGGNAVSSGNGPSGTGVQRVTIANDSTGVIGLAAGPTGGCTPYNLSGGSTAGTNSTSVKGSAGTLCSLTLISTSATLAYVRLYDSSGAPTCSSATNAKHSYPVPASTTGAGVAVNLGPFGEAFANGIGFCITGGGADTDNTNAPTGVWLNASYK